MRKDRNAFMQERIDKYFSMLETEEQELHPTVLCMLIKDWDKEWFYENERKKEVRT